MDRQVAQVVSGNRNWSTNIQGTTSNYFAIRDWPPSIGRIFTDSEEKAGAAVCLLGQTVVNNLFGEGQNPVGATIRVKNFPMKVIGVLSVKGQSSYGQDQDDVVIVPFNTAERKVLGVSAPQSTPAPAAVATATHLQLLDLRLLVGADHQLGLQLDHRGDQPIRRRAENRRRREFDVRQGELTRAKSTTRSRRSRAPCTSGITSSRSRTTTSPCAISAKLRRRPRAPRR